MPFKWLKRLIPGWKHKRRLHAFGNAVPTARAIQSRAEIVEAAKKAASQGMSARQIANAATPQREPTAAETKLDADLRKRIREIAEEDKKRKERDKQ